MSVSVGDGIVGLSPCGRSGPALLGLMLVVVTQRAVCAVGAQGIVGRGCSTALGRACWWPWGGVLVVVVRIEGGVRVSDTYRGAAAARGCGGESV